MRQTVALAALTLTGCVGSISDDDRPDPGIDTGAAGQGGSGGATGVFAPHAAGLRILTHLEYANTVRTLLGSDIAIPAGVPVEGAVEGFASLYAVEQTRLGKERVTSLDRAAGEIASLAVAPARRQTLVGCTPTGSADRVCATSFVTGFGRRLFRRPLTQDEVGRHVDLLMKSASAIGDFWGGVEMTLQVMLQSPQFLYRSEMGAPGARGGPRSLRGYEMATRLAYTLTGNTPSVALLDAAGRGELDTPEGVRQEAKRMLDDRAASQATFDRLVEAWLDFDEMRGVVRHIPESVREAMMLETLLLVRQVASGTKGGLRGAMTAPTTWLNDELARHYGLTPPGSTAMKEVALPADGKRAGLFGQGTFLAHVKSQGASALIFRGLTVLKRFLCRTTQGLPETVPEPELEPRPRTNRQYSEESRLSSGYCGACHRNFDVLGFAFEHFDAAGKYRATDAGLAIDPSGKLGEAPFADAAALAKLVADGPEFPSCVAKQAYRYATGHVEAPGQLGRIDALGRRFGGQGTSLRLLLEDLVGDPLFATVGEAP